MAKAPVNTLKIAISDIIIGTDAINAASLEVKAEGAKLDKQIQIVLASACIHAHQHGDFTMVNTVVNNLSKGIRSNAAKGYGEAFGPVRWNKKDKAFVFDANKRRAEVLTDAAHADFLKNLLETDWLSFRPEPEFRAIDTVTSAESLVKRLSGAMLEEGHTVAQDEIDVLTQAIAEINRIRGAKAAAAALAEGEQAAAPAEVVEAE